MNTIEQIVICKMMLFSYIYHHPKVRAAECSLTAVLEFAVQCHRSNGVPDDEILGLFLDSTDSALYNPGRICSALDDNNRDYVEETFYRIRNRLLPREVYRIGGGAGVGAHRGRLVDFMADLQDKALRDQKIVLLTQKICEHLANRSSLQGKSVDDIARIVGLHVDVPNPPRFEDVDEVVIRGAHGSTDIQLLQVFPIGPWTDAYTHYRYYLRIFCYSEYRADVVAAGRSAMMETIRIEDDEFYEKTARKR